MGLEPQVLRQGAGVIVPVVEVRRLAATHPEVVKELQSFAESERKRLDAGKRPVGRL